MTGFLGTGVNVPSIDISGFISSSWIYVFIVGLIGFMLIVGIAIFLFFITYNRKIIFFANVSGLGWRPVLRTRARIIKVGKSGVEVLKTLRGSEIISAYGRRMGKNTYWFAKGQDGYWYNIILGDLDAKFGMLDIEPVDRDVRMFHVARAKLTDSQYGEKRSWVEKYAPSMILLFAVIILVVGAYVVAGKINEGQKATTKAAEINQKTIELANQVLTKIDQIQRGSSGQGGSGLVPATNLSGGG